MKAKPVAMYPHMVAQWDFKKNKDRGLDINLTPAGLKVKADWKCKKCGYEWEALISTRKESKGYCPKCDKDKQGPKTQTTISDVPFLIQDWDPNNEIDPTKITATKNIKVNWICHDCGHKWQANVHTRYYERTGCPACKGLVASNANNLLVACPEAQKWTTEDLSKYTPQSVNIIHWTCPDCGFESDQPIQFKIKKVNGKYRITDCSECTGSVLHGTYADRYPDLANMYSDKNAHKLEELSAKDRDTQFIWNCDTCSNEFSSSLGSMIKIIYNNKKSHKGCPYCLGKVIPKAGESFADLYPDKAAQCIDDIDLHTIKPSNGIMRNWRCDKGHEWQATCAQRHAGWGDCPVCNYNKPQPGENTVADIYPDLIPIWSNKNKKKPIEYRFDSPTHDWIIWDCPDCGNEYGSFLQDKINGWTCPFCNDRKVAPGLNSLEDTHPHLKSEWSDRNSLPISTSHKSFTKAVYWDCPKCGGTYKASPKDRSEEKSHCPYCAGESFLPGYNSIDITHPHLKSEWSDRNEPMSNFPSTSWYRAWWICPTCGGEHLATIAAHINGEDHCKYCEDNAVLPGFNSLYAKHKEDIDNEWNWANNSLLDVDPDKIGEKNNTSVWWNCEKGHCYTLSPAAWTSYKLRDHEPCPYCDDRAVLPGFNSLYAKHKEDIDTEWDWINNSLLDVDPDKIGENNNTTVWWNCKKGHCYPLSPAAWTLYKLRGHEPCPMCKGRRRKRSHFAKKKKK